MAEPRMRSTSCQCKARAGSDYCSTDCEGAGKKADIECRCGHPPCAPRRPFDSSCSVRKPWGTSGPQFISTGFFFESAHRA